MPHWPLLVIAASLRGGSDFHLCFVRSAFARHPRAGGDPATLVFVVARAVHLLVIPAQAGIQRLWFLPDTLWGADVMPAEDESSKLIGRWQTQSTAKPMDPRFSGRTSEAKSLDSRLRGSDERKAKSLDSRLRGNDERKAKSLDSRLRGNDEREAKSLDSRLRGNDEREAKALVPRLRGNDERKVKSLYSRPLIPSLSKDRQ